MWSVVGRAVRDRDHSPSLVWLVLAGLPGQWRVFLVFTLDRQTHFVFKSHILGFASIPVDSLMVFACLVEGSDDCSLSGGCVHAVGV